MATTGRTVDYATLDAQANQLAHFWRSCNLQPGDTIALVLENHEWLFPIVWSAQRSGLYYTCLSQTLSASDLEYILGDCGAEVIIGSKRTWPLVGLALPNLKRLKAFLVDDAQELAPNLVSSIQGFPTGPIADESGGTDMLYSSGTTGRPKGVRRDLAADEPVVAKTAMMQFAEPRFGINADTIYLCPAPLYHAGPLRWSMLIQRLGGTVVVMDKFDPEAALALIERYHVTAAQWVPTHFIRMLQLPPEVRQSFDLSSLTAAIHAAAPCPIPVKEAMIEWWGPIIHEYYGGTENNGLTLIASDEWLNHRGSVGTAVLGEIKICDEHGDPLPARTEGAVFFAGGPAFSFHNDAEKTASSRNKHGWSTLGDIGWLDEDGFLYLTDRASFMIISGGVNIYPQEIENVLSVHPKVADVAVIGAPDPDMGERVVAVVQLRTSKEASQALAEELKAYTRERLGGVKTPKEIDFMEELPREPTGKLFKRLLRDAYKEKTTTPA